MNGHRIRIGNALRGSRKPAVAPLLTFDSTANLWNVTYSGPALAQWELWKRCDYAQNWTKEADLDPVMFPISTEEVLVGDETWWQVKVVGTDEQLKPVTPYSNVISSPGVPD